MFINSFDLSWETHSLLPICAILQTSLFAVKCNLKISDMAQMVVINRRGSLNDIAEYSNRAVIGALHNYVNVLFDLKYRVVDTCDGSRLCRIC